MNAKPSSMKAYVAIWLISSSCLILPVLSRADIGFSGNIEGCRTFGHTTFEISVNEYIPEDNLEIRFKSELEFPLDTYMAGLGVGLRGSFWQGKPWSVTLGLQKNLKDPSGAMKDVDWFELPQYGTHTTFSSTESDAELDALVFDINARCTFLVHPDFTLEGKLGYRYQDFSYEIFGVRGWQLDQDWRRVEFDELEGVNVIDYEISYRMPYFGLDGEIGDPTSFALRGELAFSPLVSAKDYDDHILRNKNGRASCEGTAVLAELKTVWIIRPGPRRQWHLEVGAGLVSINTKGEQVQYWYGDDPISEEDDTGNRISGIDTRITSSLYSFSAVLAIRF